MSQELGAFLYHVGQSDVLCPESGGLLAGTWVVRLVLGISRREQENCDRALFPETKMKE